MPRKASKRVEATGAAKLAQDKWEGSGLDESHALKLGLEPLEPEATAALWSGCIKAVSVKIPYFDHHGKPTKFFRIRFLGKLPGHLAHLEKPPRYSQAPGTINEAYFPPLLDKTWAEIAKDTTREIWTTEGEFKAAKGCAEGLATVGLGGVDVWKATKHGITILPGLRDIDWLGRSNPIIFDSDITRNPKVLAGALRYAAKITELGGRPKIVMLPPGPDGEKVGLDDYLLTHTVADLQALADSTEATEAGQALWTLNSEVILVRFPVSVFERKSKLMLAVDDFKNSLYVNRKHTEMVITANGLVPKVRKTAQTWIEWEKRSEVDTITYAPGAAEIVDNKLNTWRGWGVPSVKGDITPWVKLLDYIFKNDPKARKWFEQWCAYPIRFPGTKMYSAVVLWGALTGTGKTLVAYTLGRIYGDNFGKLNNKDLDSAFNAWADRRQFVYLDEITGGQARKDADYIKGLITQHEIRINNKHIQQFEVPDCINYMASSNHSNSFFIDDDDRRFLVHEMPNYKLEQTFYDAYHVAYHKDHEGPLPSYLRHYFENDVDLTGFNPRERPPMTASKLEMIADVRSDMAAWVAQLADDPASALTPLHESIRKCDLHTATTLLLACDPDKKLGVGAQGLSRELKKRFLKLKPVKCAVGKRELIVIRNREHWEKQSEVEIAKHYNKFFPNLKE